MCKALTESAATDTLLLATMKRKSIVLQRKDSDRNNRLCDIDADDEIADKEEVFVLFITVRDSIAQIGRAFGVEPLRSAVA